MIPNLKIIFLSLISCCYLNTVFEFSDNEEKQNFQFESHIYINENTIEFDFVKIEFQKKLLNARIFSNSEIAQTKKFVKINCQIFDFHKYFEPPEKRYILYDSLLI